LQNRHVHRLRVVDCAADEMSGNYGQGDDKIGPDDPGQGRCQGDAPALNCPAWTSWA